MNPEQLAKLQEQIQAAGGINNYLLYALVAFAVATVAYLGHDHIRMRPKLLRVLQTNTDALKRSAKESRLVRRLFRRFTGERREPAPNVVPIAAKAVEPPKVAQQ